MSRAINLDLTREQVVAAASKHGAAISSIIPLHPRGTRVVLLNSEEAAVLRRALTKVIIEGPIVRTPLRPRSTS